MRSRPKTCLVVAAVAVCLAVGAVGLALYAFHRAPHCLSVVDFAIALPDGYEMVEIWSETVEIADQYGTVVVTANIDGYKVYEDLVVGHVAKADPRLRPVPGYFILDTKRQNTVRGLSKERWLVRLRGYGIKEPPVLHKPTRSDEWQGYNRPSRR